jgi:predicted site-specific integrase-resolvase
MQPKSILNEYWPPDELAAELNVCTKTLDRWRVEGKGPPITKIGRRTFYSKTSVASWLRAREQRNQAAGQPQHSTA